MKKTLLAAFISAMLSVFIAAVGFIPAVTGRDAIADPWAEITDDALNDAAVDPTVGSQPVDDKPETNVQTTDEPETALGTDDIFPNILGIVESTNKKPSIGDKQESAGKNNFPSPEYPADAVAAYVTVNGEYVLKGRTASVGGTLYLPLAEFCNLFFKGEVTESEGSMTVSGEGFEVAATEGQQYITSRGRVLWCGMSGSVRRFGSVMCVPAEAVCRTLGLSLTVNNDEVTISGKAVSVSAEEVYDAQNLYWLAHIISAESRGEPLEGQIGVGSVVMNRMKSYDYLNNVYDVIFDRRYGIQFSPAYSGSIYNEPTESCVRAAKICLEGYTVSDKILYFINSDDKPASWMTEKCQLIITIGNHDFYA